jgi:hypothetical protein
VSGQVDSASPVTPAVSATPAGSGGITAGTISGITSTGPQTTNLQVVTEHATVLPPEALQAPEVVPAPAGLMNLPVRPQLFVGREDVTFRGLRR